ncbi:hypothetical protein [Bosea sp. (in: a-proteobacteria)]|uniref:hypothetical protein n=1 Tax=Bosea sp. (in: a-proteobacteria) TaxID=1871050 RepID=UPI002FC7C915
MKISLSLPTFEAELNTDPCDPYNNAELTLTLKLGFRQINPAGGAADGTYHDYGDAAEPTRRIVKWTNGAWNLWKRNFVSSAVNFWNGKFWLSNNFALYEFDKNGVKYRPNIWCRFCIEDRDISFGGHHQVIDVVRLHHSENWFGSHASLYDSLDTRMVRKGTNSRHRAIMQRAHVHEVGHLLGLDHVDVGKAHCPPGGDTNGATCYGVADADKNSVMGQGMQLRTTQAMPWRKAIIAIATQGAALTLTDWEARLQRLYPRNPAEIAAGRLVTTRQLRR